jgi:hypothetical protein
MSNYSNSTFYFSPSGYSEGQIQAQNPNSSIGALTFSRASTATRTDINNNVREVPFNLVPNGIASPSFYATQTNITSFLANTTPQPLGISSGIFKLIPNATSGQHNAFGSVPFINPEQFTYSLFVQASGYNFVSLAIGVGLVGSTIIFSLADGSFTGSESGITPFISNVGNGWYRIGFTNANVLSATTNVYVIVRNNATTANYSGDTTSGILLCAPQIVFGNLPQQYFSTGNRLNVPRIDYSQGVGALLLEPQRTNSIINSTMQGASVGTNSLPTGWGQNLSAGLTRTVVGLGVENGLNYIDVRVNGTPTSSFGNFDLNTLISASQTQKWTESIYIKIINAPSPPNTFLLLVNEFLGGSYISGSSLSITPTNTLTRYNYTHSVVNATTNNIVPYLAFSMTIGNTYDFTIRIAACQLELGAYSSTFIPTTNASATRLADSFSRDNIYTNNLISASGGTWFVQLVNNVALSALSGEFVGNGLELGNLFSNSTNAFKFRQGGGTQRLNLWKVVGGTSTNLYDLLTDTAKIAIKWNGTTADVFVNGVKQVSATSFNFTNMEFLNYLQNQRPTYISQMALYNTPLSDALCISITT